jgi:hypothetical protein
MTDTYNRLANNDPQGESPEASHPDKSPQKATPCDQADAYERMARSIIRDLIRLHRPDLEQPGALRKLVES